jgi:hypothetical protein
MSFVTCYAQATYRFIYSFFPAFRAPSFLYIYQYTPIFIPTAPSGLDKTAGDGFGKIPSEAIVELNQT